MHVSKINNRLKATRFQLTSWLSKTGESCKLQEEEELDICLKKNPSGRRAGHVHVQRRFSSPETFSLHFPHRQEPRKAVFPLNI